MADDAMPDALSTADDAMPDARSTFFFTTSCCVTRSAMPLTNESPAPASALRGTHAAAQPTGAAQPNSDVAARWNHVGRRGPDPAAWKITSRFRTRCWSLVVSGPGPASMEASRATSCIARALRAANTRKFDPILLAASCHSCSSRARVIEHAKKVVILREYVK